MASMAASAMPHTRYSIGMVRSTSWPPGLSLAEEGALECPEQEAGGGHVAERGGHRRQRAEAVDGGFEHQVGGVETRRPGHADDGQAEDQEGDGEEGDALEEAGQFAEFGGPGAAEDEADDEPHAGHRQPEVGGQQHGALDAGLVQAEDADHQQAGVADHGEGEQAAQVGLLEGERGGEENAGHGEADDVGLPVDCTALGVSGSTKRSMP